MLSTSLAERETAGDPISGLKWTRKTTDKIARQLKRLGIAVSRNTGGTVAAADEVFSAHESQEDFRRFYFRP